MAVRSKMSHTGLGLTTSYRWPCNFLPTLEATNAKTSPPASQYSAVVETTGLQAEVNILISKFDAAGNKRTSSVEWVYVLTLACAREAPAVPVSLSSVSQFGSERECGPRSWKNKTAYRSLSIESTIQMQWRQRIRTFQPMEFEKCLLSREADRSDLIDLLGSVERNASHGQ